MKINVKDYRDAEDKESYILSLISPEERAKWLEIEEKWQTEESLNGRR
jgi:hypothetical protein